MRMKIPAITLLFFGIAACDVLGTSEDNYGAILPSGVAYAGRRYVLEGTNFSIVCRLSHSLHLKWTKDGEEIDTNNKRYSFGADATKSDSYRKSVLTVLDAQSVDTGSYKCYTFDSASHDVSVIHEIITNEEKKGRGFVLELGKSIDLQCSVSDDEKVNMTWFKNNVKVDVTGGKHSLEKGNNTLTIRNAETADAGRYTCAIDGDVTKNASIELKTRATVETFDKSINLVQGDKLRLYCKVYGYPVPSIIWLKDDVPIREANATNHVKLMPDDRNVTDSILIVEHLEEGDAAVYTCYLSNDVNSVNMTITVRVKDKLAALWPFLGILAEVAILCTIIFIYEKRRAKQEYDESDTDQNNESKPVGDQKDKDIRQRK